MKKRKNIWLGLSLAAVMMMGLGGCAKGSGDSRHDGGFTGDG